VGKKRNPEKRELGALKHCSNFPRLSSAIRPMFPSVVANNISVYFYFMTLYRLQHIIIYYIKEQLWSISYYSDMDLKEEKIHKTATTSFFQPIQTLNSFEECRLLGY
jgi:hypothetical protein